MGMSSLKDHSLRVGFIGAGNMAQAIIGSMLEAGIVKPEQLMVTAPSDTRLAPLRAKGIGTTNSNEEVIMKSDVVLLCVKPHIFPSMVSGLSVTADKCRTRLYISVMAGLTLEFLQEKLRALNSPGVIRAMPNTPCLVAEGCCVYALGPGLHSSLAEVGSSLLACLGLVRAIPEQQINAAAAVAGSGPAYFYAAIEALADGGVMMGLPRELAQALAAQTLRGAGTMVQQTKRHPGLLKDEVCSPGGTTIVGMHALEKGGFRASLMNAVEAATLRASVLADQQKDKK